MSININKKKSKRSLQGKGHRLSDSMIQLNVLNGKDIIDQKFVGFEEQLEQIGLSPLRPTSIDIFQINVGKMCNQVCKHCHVDAGPDRTEIMTRKTLEKCLEILARTDIGTVDLTGGAPEMNPHFRWFVEEASKLGKIKINILLFWVVLVLQGLVIRIRSLKKLLWQQKKD